MKFSHILIPTDFSESSQVAIDYAVALRAHFPSNVTLLHVIEPFLGFGSEISIIPADIDVDLEDKSKITTEGTDGPVRWRVPPSKRRLAGSSSPHDAGAARRLRAQRCLFLRPAHSRRAPLPPVCHLRLVHLLRPRADGRSPGANATHRVKTTIAARAVRHAVFPLHPAGRRAVSAQ